jgi:hypothetical protein
MRFVVFWSERNFLGFLDWFSKGNLLYEKTRNSVKNSRFTAKCQVWLTSPCLSKKTTNKSTKVKCIQQLLLQHTEKNSPQNNIIFQISRKLILFPKSIIIFRFYIESLHKIQYRKLFWCLNKKIVNILVRRFEFGCFL